MKALRILPFIATTASAQSCPQGDDPTGPYVDPSLMGGRYGLERLISIEAFEQMFKGTQNEANCNDGWSRLTYEGLVLAARHFPDFCNNGDIDLDRLELASFLAHCAHETTGGWSTAPCGWSSYGLCFAAEQGCQPTGDGCVYPGSCPPGTFEFPECDVRPGKKYYGRGPIQLSYPYNYAQYSHYFFNDYKILLDDPDRVLEDPVVLWGSAIWFWMTEQPPKESCHTAFQAEHNIEGSNGGFGLTTMIINGGVECSSCYRTDQEADRIRNLKRFTYFLGVPLCKKPDHSITCDQVQSYDVMGNGGTAPCAIDYADCQTSNFATCYQINGSTTYPPYGTPTSSCNFMGAAGSAHTPTTRTKADCELPRIPGPGQPGYVPLTGPQYLCQESYDSNETEPPSTSSTSSTTTQPGQTTTTTLGDNNGVVTTTTTEDGNQNTGTSSNGGGNGEPPITQDNEPDAPGTSKEGTGNNYGGSLSGVFIATTLIVVASRFLR